LEHFSINIHGKVDKQELRAYHLSKISKFKLGDNFENLEKRSIRNSVMQIWRDVLEIDNIKIEQDFFKDLGGTSLLALVMIGQIEDDLKIEIRNFKQSDLTTLGSFIEYLETLPKLPRLEQIGEVKEGRGNIVFVQNGEGHSYNKLIEPFYSNYNVFILRYNQYNAELYRKGNLFFKELADLIDTKVQGGFSLVGNSFHGYIAAKISENHAGAWNVIVLDTPFYKFSSRTILKNKSTKDRNARLTRIKLLLNPFKWRKFVHRIKRKIQKDKSPKKPSEFTSSVINIVKYNSSIKVLPNTLYVYFDLSVITNIRDIQDWKNKTRGNFKSVDFHIGHLDFNQTAVYKDVAKAIIDFV
jgi:acyl carrier protein